MLSVQLAKEVRAAHNAFVTGLAFAPSVLAAQRNEDALVLSQSVDLKLLAHSLKRRRTNYIFYFINIQHTSTYTYSTFGVHAFTVIVYYNNAD